MPNVLAGWIDVGIVSGYGRGDVGRLTDLSPA